MTDTSFLAYVGDPDFHDGSILDVERKGEVVRVRIRGASGKTLMVIFGGVSSVRANRPEGMLLYAMTELRSDAPNRRFAFANWDDESDAFLEVDAADFSVVAD